jgi:hypothetical protein
MSLQDKQEITEVLHRYARAVDRKDFDTVAECYFEDAIDNHGGYVGKVDGLIEDMKVRHKTIDSSLHFITNVLIDQHEDVAEAESYCLCFLRQQPSGPDERPILVTIKCRYIDRFEKRDGTWRIADRIVVFDETLQQEVNNVLDESWVISRRSEHDPVYTRVP